MAYCTKDDFTAAGVLDADKTLATVRASALMDGYIGIKYGLPLITWDVDLTQKAADIARYLALKDRGFSGENPADAVIVNDYLGAIKWLEGVARGVPRLNVVDSTPTVYESAPLVSSEEPEWRWSSRNGYGRDGC